nr:hypothetical protein CFP56_62012 [Quercus suber]
MRAELEYSSRRPWSSSVGSERAEFSHAHKSRLMLVKEVPISRVSGLDAGVPRAETTQPDKASRMIDSELGLTVDLGALPKVVSLEVAFNEKSNPPKELADEVLGSVTSSPTLQQVDRGLQKENGPNLVAVSLVENKRPPLVDISNSCGPKGKFQAKNKVVSTDLKDLSALKKCGSVTQAVKGWFMQLGNYLLRTT